MDGNIYLMNARLRSIYKDTPAGGDRSLFSFGAKFEGGLKFGPDGYLYAAAYTGNEIVRVALDGSGTWESFVSIPNPWGIDFDENGNLFVVDNKNSDLYRIAPDKNIKKIANFPGQNTISYCRYHSGEIYLNAHSNSSIYHFPANLDTVSVMDTLSFEDFKYVNDMAFDEDGNIYITGGEISSNALFKIRANGTVIKLVTLGNELTFMTSYDKFLYISRLDGPVYKVLIPSGI